MNKNLHRIVFNAKRGQLMAVCETASSQGKSASGESTGGAADRGGAGTAGPDAPGTGLRPLSFAVAALMLLMPLLQPAAIAQVIADPSAPANQRPQILPAANGTPQVNIQTPSAAGVSRNTYIQFDVNKPGVILNNSRTNVQTQLGGFVSANPWLAGGSAKVILNEVNSSNPSQIRGYVEVAGQRAEVIIANPAGINVDGGGFLNANRVTLTTGAPVVNGGNLEAYRVQGGNITIGGQGLDTSTADYTSLLARAVQLNAGVWAKELQVVTGANQVDAAQGGATVIAGSGPAPTYALDVSNLGGMYAGKIFLIGTESGLGVRNAGMIAASGGNLVLQANGWLTNTGSLQAAGNIQANTAGALSNSGTVYAGGSTSLVSQQGGISNTGNGVIAGLGNTTVQALGAGAQVNSGATTVIAAGLNADGTLATSGNLAISATDAVNLTGQNLAGGNASLSAARLGLADSKLSAQNLTLTATGGNIDASRATVTAQGTLAASATQLLRTDNAAVSAGQLSLSASDLSNKAGEILQTGTGNTTIALSPTGTLDNTAGRIAGNSQNLTLSGQTILNTGGKIEHAGAGTLGITASTFDGVGGTIVSTGAVNLTAATVKHDNASLLANQVTIASTTLANHGGTIAQSGTGMASITATGAVDNTAGKILGNGGITLNAQSLNNQGGIVQSAGTSGLAITTSGALDNTASGQIGSAGAATLTVASFNNASGKVTAGSTLGVTTTGAVNNTQGLIAANGLATVSAATLDNTRGTLASIQAGVTATTTGSTTNDSGRIEAALDISLTNNGLSNTLAAGSTAAGSITGRNLAIQTNGQALNNQKGTIAASQGLNLQTGALNNDKGLVQTGGPLTINTHGQTLTNTNAAGYASGAGGITAQGAMTLTTGSLDNSAGFLGAKGALNATMAQVTNATGGQIVGETTVAFTSTGFDNHGGQLQSVGNATIAAGSGTINNTSGLLRSGATTSLTAASVINSNTQGANQGIEGNDVTVTAATIANDSGAIRADNNVTLTSSGTLNNNAGLISANKAVIVQDSAAMPAARTLAITNAAGTLVAGQNAAISAASAGGNGKLLSQNTLSVSLNSDFNNTGEVIANGNASFSTTGNLTNSGKLQAGGTLDVTATNINNAATGEITGATTRVTASNTLTNRGLIDGQTTEVNATTLNNLGTGRIYGDNLSIAATTLNNDAETVAGVTKSGTIAARQRLDIGATTINNGDGALIFSAGDMFIGGSLDSARKATGSASLIKNAAGNIESLGNMMLTAATIQNTNPSFSYSLNPTSAVSKLDLIARDGTAHPSTEFAWIATQRLSIPIANGGSSSISDITVMAGQFANSPYANPAYKTYYEGPDAFQAAYSTPPSGDSNNGFYYPDILAYQNNDPVWALFGMPNPPNTTPGPRPAEHWVGSDDQGHMYYPTQAELDAWQAESAPWQALQVKLNAFRTAAGTYMLGVPVYRSYTETDQTASVNAGKPGRIVSGGNMTLTASNTILNDNSQILAGGVLTATAAAVNNQATQITATLTRSGSLTRFGVTGQDCDLFGCDDKYGFITDPYYQAVPHSIFTGIAVSQSGVAVAPVGSKPLNSAPANTGSSPAATSAVSAAARNAGIVQVVSNVPLVGGVAGSTPVVRTAVPSTGIPTSGLFHTNPNPNAGFLIETDPRFANYRNWLGSDYMLAALSLDPTITQKRLGDGFYEQQLVREQIAQLTGQRFLANYTSDEVQFKALMDSALTQATALQLRPGIALTAVQMAALTSDIVWLVERTVTLPDGSTQRVLVPQVYVRVQPGDIDGAGVLLAGREVNINLSGDLTNSGTIAGRQVMSLTAENIQNLGGRISGNAVAVTARTDLNNIGGQIDAANSLVALAGRDLNIVSTTTAPTTSRVGSTVSTFSGVDRVAGLYVTNPSGTLVASAGRDANLIAGVIQSQGSATLQAGGNINLQTVKQTDSVDATRDDRNYTRWSQSQDIGSQIGATGAVSLAAGKDINATAASITSTQGALSLAAGRDININAGRTDNALATSSFVEGSGWFSSGSTEMRSSGSASRANGSSLSGNTITLSAGQNVSIKGSSVVSDLNTAVLADRNVSIEAATNTSSQSSFTERKSSGMSLDDGLFIGNKQQSADQRGNGTTAAASTVGSIAGNVGVQAGQAYKQVGSDVIAPNGDITIIAKSVDIVEARETSRSVSEEKMSQSGLSITASSPLLNSLQSAQESLSAAGKTSDGRMQALGVASAGFNAYNAYQGVTGAADAAGGGEGKGDTSFVKLNISLGSSESESKSSSQSNTAAASNIAAGNNLTIVATGAGQASNMTVQGSNITAGNNVTLLADNAIKLLASQNTASQESSNSSSSSSVGGSIGYGPGGWSFGVNASASKAQGNSSGQDTSYNNTQVTSGNTATLISGGDTSLVGAVVAANTVKATVGGNLAIESLQDTSTYTSKQSSVSASVSFDTGSKEMGASASVGQSNIDSTYQSVNQTSGIQAGNGGFQVSVAGNTDLKGAVIASTRAAIDASKNSFSTGGSLTTSDLQNSASYQGDGFSVGASMGTGKDAKGKDTLTPGGSFGVGSTSGEASSTTTAGISGIAGNTAVRTGDAATGIQKIFDAQKVQQEIDAQIAITAAFGQQASSAWGKYANQKMVDAPDEETRACWSANGDCRLAGHTVIGALGGGIEGALGAAAGTALNPYLSKAIDDLGISGPMHDILVAGLSSTVGGVLGGTSGAAGAFNEVTNNYLTSTQWQDLANKLDACAKKKDGCSSADETKIRQEFQAISRKQDVELRVACGDLGSANCRDLMKTATLGTAKQLELGQQYATTKVGLPAYYLSGSDFNTTIPLLQSKINAYDLIAACAANQTQCDAMRIDGSIRLVLTSVGIAAVTAFSAELGAVGLTVLADGSGAVCATNPQRCLNLINGIAEMASGTPISGYNPLTASARRAAYYGKTTYRGPNGEVIEVGNVVPTTGGANAAMGMGPADPRGLSELGGIFSSTTNGAGGKIWTSTGTINQRDFAPIVNSELMQGKNVNIISGVHGGIDGSLVVDRSMFIDDVKAFGQIPGVKVFNYTDLSPQQLKTLLQGSDTTIGGFCNSGTCFKK